MKRSFIYFGVFLILFAFVFRSLLLNFSSSLIDWRDYALMVWIIFQHIDKILSLNFQNYFNTTSFYPNPYSLLFSDLLLPQAILTFPFYLLTKNLILSFNLVFVLTFVLNYISSFLFWRLIFKKEYLAFLGSIFFIFSSFFHLEISHFQMLSYWPFFFSLYFLLKSEGQRKNLYALLSGVFLSIQFLASVYLSFYLLASITIILALRLLKHRDLKSVVKQTLLVFAVFLAICGVFIKGYMDMRKTYNANRDIKEYISYSANLSDYLFFTPIDSFIHNLSITDRWNNQNKSQWSGMATSPGIIIFVLSLVGLIVYKRDKKNISFSVNLDYEKGFFFLITAIGFIFSLGPRLVFNGTYAHLPLPYAVVLKFLPFFEAIRVSSRWSFLFYFGLVFFALIGIQKLTNNKYKNYVLVSCFILFLLELLPLSIRASSESYYDARDLTLKDLCQQERQVVLELPVSHLNAGTDIANGLSYITKAQLASTVHKCPIMNGYSGYDLPSIAELAQRTDDAIDRTDVNQFISDLKDKGVTIVKFNPDDFPTPRQPKIQTFFEALVGDPRLTKIDQTIYRIN